jgi:transposase-like protein
VLWAVRWYCRYGVSYCDLEQMMGERGVLVDHSTIRARYGEKAALAVADAALDKLARR